ncbi:hypothetical protein [Massilia sp. DD77]|uniref:hypothetical protein n=1 Tax=Massilia sp. DD77 TaxID=3109349 RepID=UPI002FFF4972
MPMSEQEIHALTWNELRELKQEDLSDLSLLAGTIAGIVTATNGAGFKAAPLPVAEGDERTRSDLVRRAVGEAASGAIGGRTLPRRAVLWEIDADKRPLESTTAVPPEAAWIKDSSAQALGVYKGVAGSPAASRRFMLFAPADNGFSGPPGFVSSLSRTGFIDGTLHPIQVSRRKTVVAWAAGLLSLAVFCVCAANIHEAGKRAGDCIDLMTGKVAGYTHLLQLAYNEVPASPPYSNGSKAVAPDKAGAANAARAGAGSAQAGQAAPGANQQGRSGKTSAPPAAHRQMPDGAACMSQFAGPGTQAAGPATEAEVKNRYECLRLWTAAMTIVSKNSLSAQAGNQPEKTRLHVLPASWMSIQVPMIFMMLSVIGLAMAAGLALMGRVSGILINNVYRMSLARFQIVAWSVLILPTVIAYACFNAGMIGDILQLSTTPGEFGILSDKASKNLVVFPVMPMEILAALGITVVSTMLSPLILTAKETGVKEGVGALQVIAGAGRAQNANVSTYADAPTRLTKNPSPADARISDLLLGEERGNRGEVDISRLQMFVITVGLVFTYMSLILTEADSIHVSKIARAFSNEASLFNSLPPVGATFVILLAISHSAYLITKSVDKPVPPVLPAAPPGAPATPANPATPPK